MISSLTPEAWDKKTIELGGSILQSWAWGEFQQAVGHQIKRFSGDDFICLGVVTELALNKQYLYCPRGPVGNSAAALVDLKKLEADRGLVFARIEPQQAVKLPEAVKDTQPKNNWMVNLEKSEEEILIGMKPKTRYNINLAQRKGVVVREGTKEDLLPFFQLMLETAARNQFRLHPQNYYLQMWEHLFPKNLRLLLATYENQVLAGALISLYGDTAVYLHGGSSQRMKEAMAPYVLHWEAMRLARNQGMKLYDLGGISGTNDQKHAWAGISRFKKGFGGFEVIFPGAFDLIYSPIWYNVYKQARLVRKLIR